MTSRGLTCTVTSRQRMLGPGELTAFRTGYNPVAPSPGRSEKVHRAIYCNHGYFLRITPIVENMQRVVGRYRVSKFDIFRAAGGRGGSVDISRQNHWSWNMECTRNLSVELMRSSSPGSAVGKSRLGNFPVELRGHRALGFQLDVPGGRVATRCAPRRTRSFISHRSRNRSSRIQCAKDFTPQSLLECAVDVLREFNRKMTNWRQGLAGGRDLHQFSSAAEVKQVSNAESVAEEEGASMLGERAPDSPEEQSPKEFEWRTALWEAELSSAEEVEALSEAVEPSRDAGLLNLESNGLSAIAAGSKGDLNGEELASEMSTVVNVASPELEFREIDNATQSSEVAPHLEVDIGDLWNRRSQGHLAEADAEPEVGLDSQTWVSSDLASVSTELHGNEFRGQEQANLESAITGEGQGVSGLVMNEEIHMGERMLKESDANEMHADHEQIGEVPGSLITDVHDIRLNEVDDVGSTEPVPQKAGVHEDEERLRMMYEDLEPSDTAVSVSVAESLPLELEKAEEEFQTGTNIEATHSSGTDYSEPLYNGHGGAILESAPTIDAQRTIASGTEGVGSTSSTPAVEKLDSEAYVQESSEGLEPSFATDTQLTTSASSLEDEVKVTSAPAIENFENEVHEQGSADQTSFCSSSSELEESVFLNENFTPKNAESPESEGNKSVPHSHEEDIGDDIITESVSPPPDGEFLPNESVTEADHRDLQHIEILQSDAAYDGLVQELNGLEGRPASLEPSQDILVGAEPSPKMQKVPHSVPMLSLASMQKETDVLSWHYRLTQKLPQAATPVEWVVEPKVDGLALSLRYESGELKVAATRGDGIQGEDVTRNARRVSGIPQNILYQAPGTSSNLEVLEVRGEIFMSLRQFEELNTVKMQSGAKPMSNPRNAAAGSMRLLSSPSDHELRPVNFTAYSIASIEVSEESSDAEGTALRKPSTQWEALMLLESLGFSVNKDNQLCDSFESALQYAERWRATRRALDYEADGVVLKVNDLATQASLGSIGGDPRWAVAWKFAATEALSILEGIELTVGRSGVIIPNARFKPVEIGGAVVSRASLHNFGHVKALGLCEGDHIVVQRAGDVIPQISQVLEDLRPETAEPWVPPTECPSCGSKLTEASGSAMIFCSNSLCTSRTFRQAAHFAKTLIPGIGSGTLTQLDDEQLVQNPADFYNMNESVLAKVKGFGKLSISKLLKAIEDSKQQDLWLFITALGIPKVGANTAKELAKEFGSLPDLMAADVKRLQSVRGIGAATAAGIFEWCQGESNIDLVQRLAAAGCRLDGSDGSPTIGDVEILESKATSYPGDADLAGSETANGSSLPVDQTSGSAEGVDQDREKDVENGVGSIEATRIPDGSSLLSGKTIVITGEFENATRKDMKELISSLGATVRNSVSSRTSILLCGRRPGPVKLVEAERFGIETIDWETFNKRFQLGLARSP